jgi:hypothetical protein
VVVANATHAAVKSDVAAMVVNATHAVTESDVLAVLACRNGAGGAPLPEAVCAGGMTLQEFERAAIAMPGMRSVTRMHCSAVDKGGGRGGGSGDGTVGDDGCVGSVTGAGSVMAGGSGGGSCDGTVGDEGGGGGGGSEDGREAVIRDSIMLRSVLIRALASGASAAPTRVVLNYHMDTLGQRGFQGHLSPVAAYDADTGETSSRFVVVVAVV